MNEKKQRLMHLCGCSGIGWETISKVVKEDPELTQLYCRDEAYWNGILHNPEKKLKVFLNDLHRRTKQSLSQDIKVISIFDEAYPARLRQIHHPPFVLYCRGNTKLLHEENNLAVIGTRSPSSYGIAATKEIVPGVARRGYVIVSGLAYGIDALAHSVAVNNGGNCIAVIGGGLNKLYPKENTLLADKILANAGLIISEYQPDTLPKPWHFPMRNRIISGISKGIFVVEGKARSGTFITVQQGLDQGKDIFALPGSIFSENSICTNFLIKEGAKLVINSKDIIAEWE